MLEAFVRLEKAAGRFIVAGGAIATGTVVATAGVVVTGALVAAIPQTFGISAVGIPGALSVIAGGELLIAFGTDIYINELNAFLGTQIAGPGDIFPGIPRFDPIFQESIFKKLDRGLCKIASALPPIQEPILGP